jgi:hypothetical protein
MDVAVVTGNTSAMSMDNSARDRSARRLYLCLNRGSEVYAVGEEGPI